MDFKKCVTWLRTAPGGEIKDIAASVGERPLSKDEMKTLFAFCKGLGCRVILVEVFEHRGVRVLGSGFDHILQEAYTNKTIDSPVDGLLVQGESTFVVCPGALHMFDESYLMKVTHTLY